MPWYDKLPSLRPIKGVSTFFYLLTHWETISQEYEEFRRQIKDREAWAKTALKVKGELHALDRERLEQQLEVWRAEATRRAEAVIRAADLLDKFSANTDALSQELEQVRVLLKRVVTDLLDAIGFLSITVAYDERQRGALLSTLQPRMRELVETAISGLPAPGQVLPPAEWLQLRKTVLTKILEP